MSGKVRRRVGGGPVAWIERLPCGGVRWTWGREGKEKRGGSGRQVSRGGGKGEHVGGNTWFVVVAQNGEKAAQRDGFWFRRILVC